VLTSPRLSFTRDGRRLIALDDALSIVELATGATRRILIDHPRGAIGFVDQIWVAHGHDTQLARFSIGGGALGSTPLVGDSMLVAAPVGAPAAVWSTSALFDDGQLRTISVPTADLVLPLTARRWVTVTGARVVAPSGLSCELSAGSRVQGGAIILDGTAVALLIERAGTREIVVVGLSNGRAQHRQAIRSGVPRIAVRRGILGLQVAPRELALVDLRSARALGELRVPFDICDFALDPDGSTIAVRDGGTSIELIDVKEALAAKPTVVVEAEIVDAPVADPLVRVVPVAATAPPPRFARPFDLRCLSPITPVEPRDRASSLELLDTELRTTALWTLNAIARAWDTRRLGFGNEGNHPFEHEVAALLGMNAGFAEAYVGAANEHLATHVLEIPADARDASTPLGMLAREFDLCSLALDILLVVAAPALWSESARLYGILANDPARPLVDEALVEQILDTRSRHEIAGALDSRAPLMRLGILTKDGKRARPFAGLAVDPIILARLRCELPSLGVGVTTRGSSRALEELVVASCVVEAAISTLGRVQANARIVVRGRAGTGRRTLLAAITAEAHRALGIVDMLLLSRAELAGALRRAQLAGLLPCIVGLEEVSLEQREDRDALVEILRIHPGPLAVVTSADHAVPLDPGHVNITLPILGESERLGVWRAALADAGMASNPEILAARYRIGPGSIHRAITATIERGPTDADATGELERYIRQTRDTRLCQHARRVERLASWDNLVLPPDILDSLRELVGRVRHRRTVFETWGMDQTMATSRGLTALFSGPPGTGKTLVAGVIARELGLDLYQIDLSKLMSKWIGETERNLGTIFDAAEDGQVILLFDEADSLFAKRTEVRSSNDRYANLEVNYLLQRLDSFEGIAILTTNAASSVDPAFKRRLSFRLSFPFPDEDTREQLWRAHLPASLPTHGPLALDKLAHKYQLSGGYIRNACLRAAFLAAQDETTLTQDHLDRAVTLEYAELGKLSNSGAID
jgi:ATPase family associated with various cellular activities (AAA)